MLNIYLKYPKNNKCLCECYLYEKYDDIVKKLYLHRTHNNCLLYDCLSKLQVTHPCYIWVTIISPFLNNWFLSSLQHSLVIRRLSSMPCNYKLTAFEDLLCFLDILGQENLLYNQSNLKINSGKSIEVNINDFYKEPLSLFLEKNVNEVYVKDFYKHINPILYYNLTSAYEIISSLEKNNKLNFVFMPILEFLQEEFQNMSFDYLLPDK